MSVKTNKRGSTILKLVVHFICNLLLKMRKKCSYYLLIVVQKPDQILIIDPCDIFKVHLSFIVGNLFFKLSAIPVLCFPVLYVQYILFKLWRSCVF